MTAKEMFKQLGYKREYKLGINSSLGVITYSSHNNTIMFYEDTRRVGARDTLCIAEIKAVVQQIRELEWLDE